MGVRCAEHGSGDCLVCGEQVKAERDQLRAEVERLKKCILDGAIPSMNAVEKERDVALLQVEELKKALLDAARLLTLFHLGDLNNDDVRAFMPRVQALVLEKRVGVSIHDAKPCPTCGKLMGAKCPECSEKKEGDK